MKRDGRNAAARRRAAPLVIPNRMWLLLRMATTNGYYRVRGRGFRAAAAPPVGRAQSDPRRLGRAARSAAQSGPRAKSRSRADFDPASWSSNISPIWPKRGRSSWRSPPIISSWRPGSPTSNPACCCPRIPSRTRARRRSPCGFSCGCSGSTRCARRAPGCSAAIASAATSSCAARRRGCGWSARRCGRFATSTCSPPTARSARALSRRCTSSTPRSVMTLEEAIERVGRMIGMALDWTLLESFLPANAGPAAPSLRAGFELPRRAGARAPRPARVCAGRGVRADPGSRPLPDGRAGPRHRSDLVRLRRADERRRNRASMSARASRRSRSAQLAAAL